MKIVAVEAVPFRLPVRADFRWAGLRAGIGNFVLVRLRTDEGLVGLGEATPLPDWGGDHGRRGGETLGTVCHVVRDLLSEVLLGADPGNIERLLAAMDVVVRGHSYAKCAVDIALHDLLGKVAGLPLYRLLGGAARERVPVAHMVGLMPIEAAVAEAGAAVADGVRALQIKGGVEPERDVLLVERLRECLGPGVHLRLDANQGYRRAKDALALLPRLEAARLDALEQPVIGVDELAVVTAATGVRVIADESCWDARDALECLAVRAADAISIYLAKAGGIARAGAVAAIAEAGGLDCDVNGSIESGVGNAANLHFAFATPAVRLASVIPVSAPAGAAPYKVAGHYYDDDIVVAAFHAEDGALLPLERPGLGVEIDEDKLEQFRVD